MSLSEIAVMLIAFLTATGGFAGFAELRKVKLAQEQFLQDQKDRADKAKDEAELRDADLSSKWRSMARDASDEAIAKSTKLREIEIEFQSWKLLSMTREKKSDERSQFQAEQITALEMQVKALAGENKRLRAENEKLSTRIKVLEDNWPVGLPIPKGENK